jgi:hypothetical protein
VIEFVKMPANKMSKLINLLKSKYSVRRELKEKKIILFNILSHHKDPIDELKRSGIRIIRYKQESYFSYKKLGY